MMGEKTMQSRKNLDGLSVGGAHWGDLPPKRNREWSKYSNPPFKNSKKPQHISDHEMRMEQTRFFEMNDSIMEVDILNQMKLFISNGGQPEIAVQYLSEKYRGFAQMCNLLFDWLQMCGVDARAVNELVENALAQLILQHFDPRKADKVFEEGVEAPPWIESMIKEPQWRNVIYQLAEKYRNCLLLNFAIQRISDHGYQTEIASLATASTYFRVFSKVLKDTICHICELDEVSLEHALEDFKKMGCYDQHTYLYTQTLLHCVISEAGYHGDRLKRLSQELEYSVLDKGRIVQWMSFLLSSIHEHPSVAAGIIGMISAGATNPSDINKLYSAYSQDNPPSVKFLRHPLIFDLLIKDLFNPLKNINAHIGKYFFVLAYAASVDKGDKELFETVKALETVQPICHRNSFGSELQASLEDLKYNIRYPVVSMGILHWIRLNLTDPDYYTTSYNTLCIPIHLELLRDIAQHHPLQRPQVLELLATSFEMKTGLDALAALDMKRNLLDNILFLMQCGYVLPVMNLIEKWAFKTDQSLIRHFVVKLLDLIEPPYSYTFLSSLLRIIERPACVEALKTLKHTDKKDTLINFVKHCLVGAVYPWTDKEIALLRKLQDTFG